MTATPPAVKLPASFRDPSGFLFQAGGVLYRQVNKVYQSDYDQLMAGLYPRLVQKKLLLAHEEVDVAPPLPEPAYKVIRPERLKFVSYPYEWSFSQLKDAALLTLRLQKLAMEAGLTLKDASAYNIQLHNGRPALIDTLSFAAYREGQPWVAYRQFCMHFLAPLALMAYVDVRLGRLSQNHIDGVPLDLAARLLPWHTRLNFGLLTHLHAHAASQKRFASPAPGSQPRQASMSRTGLTGLIENLESTVRGLEWKPSGTEWAEYYSATNYSGEAFEAKQRIIKELILESQPGTLWDLGANTGVFSRLACELPGCTIISSDIDPGAVELNYRECRKQKLSNIHPLVIDLTNPSPAIGWDNQERNAFLQRGPADLVVALALIHHLAISNNVPLPELARWMSTLGRRLLIEFVPKEDSQVQKLLASREDIFPTYSENGFLEAFSGEFRLLKKVEIPQTLRAVYWFESRRFA